MPERKVLHRDVAVLARDAEVVDLRDRGIGDVVEQLELRDEALEARVARQRAAAAVQDLEDDLLAALRAERHVHRHAVARREAAAHVVAEQPHDARHGAAASAEQAFAVQHRALHGAQDLLAAEQRLRDVVERAGLDRLDRRVLAALGRQQDDGGIAGIRGHGAQRLERRVLGRAVLREVAADEQDVEALEPVGVARSRRRGCRSWTGRRRLASL